MTESTNGRVTMALLAQKLDHVLAMQAEDRHIHEQLVKITAMNEKNIALLGVRTGETEKDVEKLATATDKAIEGLNNKFNLFSGANSALGAVALAIATYFGVSK